MLYNRVISETKDKQEKLSFRNREFFRKFVTYTSYIAKNKDQDILEKRMLEILDDIIAAQEDGLDADEYFGKDPEKIAQEIVEITPRKGFLTANGIYGAVAMVFLIHGFQFSNLDVGNAIILAILGYWLTIYGNHVVSGMIYNKKGAELARNDLKLAGLLLAFIVVIAVGVLVKTPFIIEKNSWSYWVFNGILCMLLIWNVWRSLYIKKKK